MDPKSGVGAGLDITYPNMIVNNPHEFSKSGNFLYKCFEEIGWEHLKKKF